MDRALADSRSFARRRSVAAAAALISATLIGCSPARSSAPPRPIAIVTGRAGGVLDVFGRALADVYSRHAPAVTATARLGRGLEANLDDLQSGRADLALVDSETTYVGFRKGTPSDPHPHSRVRAIAVLFPTVVHVFVRQELPIAGVGDLKGRHIAVGVEGSYADQVMRLILNSYGLDYSQVHARFEVPADVDDLRAKKLDGVVFYTPFMSAPIGEFLRAVDLRLLSIDPDKIAAIQGTSVRNHFLKSTTIPRSTYSGQESDVLTVGEDVLLLCREDLPDALVYALTKALFESLSDLAAAHPAGKAIDPDRGPTASIPLHAGAARYYREHELPR